MPTISESERLLGYQLRCIFCSKGLSPYTGLRAGETGSPAQWHKTCLKKATKEGTVPR